MTISELFGASLSEPSLASFSTSDAFLQWVRGRSVGTELVGDQRLNEFYRLLDLDCNGELLNGEIATALNLLSTTLQKEVQAVDFAVNQVNSLSTDLIALTNHQLMGITVYKLFHLANQSIGAGVGYFSLTKEEFQNAIRAGMDQSSWFAKHKVWGVTMSSSDVLSLLFDSLQASTSKDGVLSMAELGSIYNNIEASLKGDGNAIDQTLAAERIAFVLGEESGSSVGHVTEASLNRLIELTFKPTIEGIFKSIIDQMDAQWERVRAAIET